ncbi:Uncharacterised protein [Streptococcus pneumoniae]|nr:Uncharacterised protein [Streptococcus pneumoniae]
MVGSTTGASKSMCQRNPAPAGSRPSSIRAARNIPWAIAPFMPNSRAETPVRWIGFQSPETPAYRRPAPVPKRHWAVGVGGTKSGRAGRSGRRPERWTPLARYRETPSHSSASSPSSPGPSTVTTTSTAVPAWCGTRPTARAVTRRAVSAATGRWCRTVLLRCTSPGRGSGNSGSAISSMAAPNTWVCTRTEGRSAGLADPTAPRHAVTASAGMRWPVTTT